MRSGETGRDRTVDPYIKSVLLYQLSYGLARLDFNGYQSFAWNSRRDPEGSVIALELERQKNLRKILFNASGRSSSIQRFPSIEFRCEVVKRRRISFY